MKQIWQWLVAAFMVALTFTIAIIAIPFIVALVALVYVFLPALIAVTVGVWVIVLIYREFFRK